jgi:Flp pilus assembly pilin Flp
MIETLKNFRDDEEGAVTVDWVVLTAGIVGLAIVVVTTVADGVYDLADRIAHVLGSHIHPT